MLEKFPIFLSIFSATIITFISIVKSKSLYETAINLILVIIIFYILGLAVRFYLKKNIFIQKNNSEVIDKPEFTENENL